MNVEEVKRAGPSLLQDIELRLFSLLYLDRHPDYSIKEGDILSFVVGHFPESQRLYSCAFTHRTSARLC